MVSDPLPKRRIAHSGTCACCNARGMYDKAALYQTAIDIAG
jgi:hypothetical protein